MVPISTTIGLAQDISIQVLIYLGSIAERPNNSNP